MMMMVENNISGIHSSAITNTTTATVTTSNSTINHTNTNPLPSNIATIVFIVEATSNLSESFQIIYEKLLSKIIRFFEENFETTIYSLVEYKNASIFCDHSTVVKKSIVTTDQSKIINTLKKIQFMDGDYFSNALLEGMVAGLEIIDKQSKYCTEKNLTISKQYCILISHSSFDDKKNCRFSSDGKYEKFSFQDAIEQYATSTLFSWVHALPPSLSIDSQQQQYTRHLFEDYYSKLNQNTKPIHLFLNSFKACLAGLPDFNLESINIRPISKDQSPLKLEFNHAPALKPDQEVVAETKKNEDSKKTVSNKETIVKASPSNTIVQPSAVTNAVTKSPANVTKVTPTMVTATNKTPNPDSNKSNSTSKSKSNKKNCITPNPSSTPTVLSSTTPKPTTTTPQLVSETKTGTKRASSVEPPAKKLKTIASVPPTTTVQVNQAFKPTAMTPNITNAINAAAANVAASISNVMKTTQAASSPAFVASPQLNPSVTSPAMHAMKQQKAQLAFIKSQQLNHQQHIARNQAIAGSSSSNNNPANVTSSTINSLMTASNNQNTLSATTGLGILQNSVSNTTGATAKPTMATNLSGLVSNLNPLNALAALQQQQQQKQNALSNQSPLWQGQISWVISGNTYSFSAQVSMVSSKQTQNVTPESHLAHMWPSVLTVHKIPQLTYADLRPVVMARSIPVVNITPSSTNQHYNDLVNILKTQNRGAIVLLTNANNVNAMNQEFNSNQKGILFLPIALQGPIKLVGFLFVQNGLDALNSIIFKPTPTPAPISAAAMSNTSATPQALANTLNAAALAGLNPALSNINLQQQLRFLQQQQQQQQQRAAVTAVQAKAKARAAAQVQAQAVQRQLLAAQQMAMINATNNPLLNLNASGGLNPAALALNNPAGLVSLNQNASGTPDLNALNMVNLNNLTPQQIMLLRQRLQQNLQNNQ